ncbi:hypothetical protein L7F22_060306 [Adiantum nelumboides]|nr:hypothetical protein [Adiantum nelumboides]
MEKFLDLHLKANVYKHINFSEKKQQFCARLPEEWREYVNVQCSRTIPSKSKVHKEHLKAVFQALKENKLYINHKKSEFCLETIHYLGHIISKDGIRMDPQKLEVINAWLEPRNLHELQSFIGMCSYYRTFIAKFSATVGPLHDLRKKNHKYVWTDKER